MTDLAPTLEPVVDDVDPSRLFRQWRCGRAVRRLHAAVEAEGRVLKTDADLDSEAAIMRRFGYRDTGSWNDEAVSRG